jgi:hypothetical protein
MAESPFDRDAAAGLEMPEGAAYFDPVRWRYIVVLARRGQQHHGEAKRLLDGKLAAALADYRQRFEQTRNAARITVERLCEQFPDADGELRRLLASGDFGALKRYAAALENRHSPLADLSLYLALQQTPEGGDGGAMQTSGVPGELKAIRQFRRTWSALAVDKQLAQAIEQAPDNAGPLNSQRLVLRSLALMREISPDYLRRFMSYTDALLWLDQAAIKDKPAAKKGAPAKRQ